MGHEVIEHRLASEMVELLIGHGFIEDSGVTFGGVKLFKLGTPLPVAQVATGEVPKVFERAIPRKPRAKKERPVEQAVAAKAAIPTPEPVADVDDPGSILDDVEPSESSEETQQFTPMFLSFWESYPLGGEAGNMYATSKVFEKMSTANKLNAINKVKAYAAAWKSAPAERRKFIFGPLRWIKEQKFHDTAEAYIREATGGDVGAATKGKTSARTTNEDRGGDEDSEDWIDEIA